MTQSDRERDIERITTTLEYWRTGRTGDWYMLENEIANDFAAIRQQERDRAAEVVLGLKKTLYPTCADRDCHEGMCIATRLFQQAIDAQADRIRSGRENRDDC